MRAIKLYSWRFGIIAALLVALFALYPSALCAAANIIDDISVNSVPEGSEIHIKFNTAMRYQTHSPKERGDLLQIQFLPIQRGTAFGTSDIHEELSWKPSQQVPLTDVTYEEGASGRSILTLRFSDPIAFQVKEGKDLRSVVVTIVANEANIPDKKKNDKPIASVGPEGSLPPAAKDTIKSSAKKLSVDQATMLFTTMDASYRYAINLKSSMEPFEGSATSQIDIPENLLIYTSIHEKDGKTWHRLRLGFFPTKKAAEPVLESLEKQFPIAWVTKVPLEERERANEHALAPLSSLKEAEPKVLEARQNEKMPQQDTEIAKKHIAPTKKKIVKTSEVAPIAIIDPSYRYAINLRSSLQPFEKSALSKIDIPENQLLYTTLFEKDGKVWHRLRVGFFASKKDAQPVLMNLEKEFPNAWITKVSVTERAQYAQQAQAVTPGVTEVPVISAEQVKQPPQPTERPLAVPAEKVTEERKSPGIPEARVEQLAEEGKVVMTSGDYRRAIQIYTKLLQAPDEKIRQQAQEFLGLARERNGQLAHAKAEYEKYLSLYPEGEGAERVRQRLAGLLTARAEPKEQLRKPKKTKAEKVWQADFFGSFSQFYDYDESFTDIAGSIVNRSSLLTDLDFNARFRSNRFDLRSQFIGGYEEDFRGSKNDDTTVNTLYFDALDKKINLSGRIGRQSRSTGGVLGRFDGGLFGYQIHPQVLVNLVSGYPVVSVSDGINTDKYFYGISFDLGTFAKKWDFNTFFINQEVDNITDRRAIGGEVRFFHPRGSFFSVVDYDIHHDDLNTILFSGNLFFKNRDTLNLMIDYRKSPILTTTNAIIGQGVESVSDLLSTFSEDELRFLAEDRTATSQSYMIGGTHYFNQKLQLTGDFTASKLSDTDASGGVEAFEGTDFEYFYSVQLIGSSLIKQGDIAILGLRYSDTDRSDNISLSLNTRYPFGGRKWLINPRFQFDYRNNSLGSGDQVKIRPSFRLNYRALRRLNLELEGGAEWNDSTFFDQEEKTWGYFIFVGYRFDF